MPEPNKTLEAQLLKKATSIGPDPFGQSQLTLGIMPVPGGFNFPPMAAEGIGAQMGGELTPSANTPLDMGRKLQNIMDLHGPDWVKALQDLYGTPKSSLVNPATKMVGNPLGKIGDLLLSRAMGAGYDHLPPAEDIIPRIANKFLPVGRFRLSTDPKLDK